MIAAVLQQRAEQAVPVGELRDLESTDTPIATGQSDLVELVLR